MSRPLLLDLFCCAGGAAVGYHRAGFDVIGVDIKPQPRYPFRFIQADAMTYPLEGFDAIHASPPCQDHSTLRSISGDHGTGWMLAATRERLQASGLPWVMENVAGAPMAPHIILCGTMFGLGVGEYELRRKRLFETADGLFVLTPPCQHRKRAITVGGHGGGADGTKRRGGVKGTLARADEARQAMGIDWMTHAEIVQAVPPAYTEHIGRQLLNQLAVTA